MKILTKLWLAVALLSMGALRAAQAPVQKPISKRDWPTLEPVQEPIYGTQQWQQAGRTFSVGLYEKAGANSLVRQLPQYVARDIIKLIKPKEEYGFIKNFTDKAIVYFFVPDGKDPNEHCLHFQFNIIADQKSLAPKHQLRCFITTEKNDTFVRPSGEGVRRQWWPWMSSITDRLGVFRITFQDEPEMYVREVHFSDLMNIEVYKEKSGRVRLEVTSPYHAPVSYYAEPIKS